MDEFRFPRGGEGILTYRRSKAWWEEGLHLLVEMGVQTHEVS